MGQTLKRPIKMYNIEARAHKAVDKAKTVPKAAPRYPTVAAIEARNKASLDVENSQIHQKLPELEERLKQVYVESTGDNPKLKTKRALPQDRTKMEEPEFGYLEPLIITPGKITLRLACDMITSHKDDPHQWSAANLAEKYKLDLETTHHILEYFKHFHLKLPKAEEYMANANPAFKSLRLKSVEKQIEQAQQLLDDGGYGHKKK